MTKTLLLAALLSGPLLASGLQPASLAADTVPPPTAAELARADSLKLEAFATSLTQGVPGGDSLARWQPPPPDSTAGALSHAQGNLRRDSVRTWLAQNPDSLRSRVQRLRTQAQDRRQERLAALPAPTREVVAQQLKAYEPAQARRRHAVQATSP